MCFHRHLIYIERLITTQYFSAPVLFHSCYFPSLLSLKFWPRVNFRLRRRSRDNNRQESQHQFHFIVTGVLTRGIRIPPVRVSECRLCLCHLNFFSSVHPGPLPPVVSDADSLSQTSAPLYAHLLLPVLSLTHFDSPGSPQHPQ